MVKSKNIGKQLALVLFLAIALVTLSVRIYKTEKFYSSPEEALKAFDKNGTCVKVIEADDVAFIYYISDSTITVCATFSEDGNQWHYPEFVSGGSLCYISPLSFFSMTYHNKTLYNTPINLNIEEIPYQIEDNINGNFDSVSYTTRGTDVIEFYSVVDADVQNYTITYNGKSYVINEDSLAWFSKPRR